MYDRGRLAEERMACVENHLVSMSNGRDFGSLSTNVAISFADVRVSSFPVVEIRIGHGV
jgi:hypothetical protein